MRYRNAAWAVYVLLIAFPCTAQTPAETSAADPQVVPPPPWAFNDLACAPALALDPQYEANLPTQRVLGSQDSSVRGLLGPGDTLVIAGGSNSGLQPGQRYFVRRLVTNLSGEKSLPPTVHTAGWIQIVGVDTTLATATVVHACDGIMFDDYLEPFTPPVIAAKPVGGTTPQYTNMGHIMTGNEGTQTAGAGQTMTIDRGSNIGVVLGQRFLVFRDRRGQKVDATGKSKTFESMGGRLPLVEIGEVLVVAVRPADSTVQVLAAKDAIITGDLIAPIR
jgi:hypothetical protein